jgi:hypothetical protein
MVVREGPVAKVDGVITATGRGREEWFALLDEWGAAGRSYRDIFDWLVHEHDLSKWWSQKLIVEYQQARGLRRSGVRPNGTFEVSTSKTMNVPVELLFDAFVNPSRRQNWLTDGKMSLRTSQKNESARFDWEDGSTRVNVSFIDRGPDKSIVSVAHERLDDEGIAGATKADWKDRLAHLKRFLEE